MSPVATTNRLFKSLRIRGSKSRVVEVGVTSFDEVGPLLGWAEPSIALQMRLPGEWLRMQGAFAYAGGWHPFIEALRGGPGNLEEFYRLFAPTTFSDMYFLDDPSNAPPWELPWLGRVNRTPPPGECGLGPEHGVSFYGPVTTKKIQLEMTRLKDLDSSIRTRGYDPGKTDAMAGYFLRRGDEYRFLLRGGKHRAAVLAHQGAREFQVRIRKGFPRVIDRRDSEDWPLVRTGGVTQSAAEQAFDRYFDFDGTQQHARWMANK